MATYFVSSAGSNTLPYDTEAKAANSLATINSLAWTANDTVKISSTHSETIAAPSFLFPSAPGLKILSVLFNGSGTGALTAGATITNSSNGTAFTLSAGSVYCYGVSFIGNSGTSNSNTLNVGAANLSTQFVFENCTFSVPGSGTGRVTIGVAALNVDTKMDFIGCTFSAGANKGVTIRNGIINFDNITFSGTAPTTLFTLTTLDFCNIELRNSDLSGIAWTNIVDVGSADVGGFFRAIGCKLRSGFTTSTGTFDTQGFYVEVIDCNSGDVNYYYKRDSWEGTVTAVNTIYYDASDGADSISWQLVSSSNCSYIYPLKAPSITYINKTLSAMQTTVEIISDGVTFKDNEIWQITTSKTSSGSPLGVKNTADKADILAAGANQDTSTVSWTGVSGFGSQVKQKLVSGSFTPAEVGRIIVEVSLAKASSTVYVSPKVFASSPRQFMGGMGGFINESVVSTDPGQNNVISPTGYTINDLSITGQYVGPAEADVKDGVSYGVGLTGTFSGGTYTDPGTANVRLNTSYIFNSVTQTGSLVVPEAVSGTAGTVNIGNIKETIRYVLDVANTTTGSPIDLSNDLSSRVKTVMKLNPEQVRQDIGVFPYVTIFASRKSIQPKTIAVNQVSGKRRADLTLSIVGVVWNDYTDDNREDPADEDVEKLMENVEYILRYYATLNNIVNWQFPTDITYHTAAYDEQTHMRIGLMDLQVTVFY